MWDCKHRRTADDSCTRRKSKCFPGGIGCVLKRKYQFPLRAEEDPLVMNQPHKDIFHGVTLEMVLNCLLKKHGWEGLYSRIKINCFAKNPSIKSSLTFLRRTPWAREKVENLYRYLKPEDRQLTNDDKIITDNTKRS